MSQNNTYNQRINAAMKAGFEIYVTHNADGCECTIMTNTDCNSQYNGECLDIWESGHYEQYSQFKGQSVSYQVA